MIELLAPAGSYEGFEAALGAGADAVYVGGQAFSARAYARNFTEEELLKAIDTAHLLGKKLYLTVNTLVKNKELEETFSSFFRPYYERGLDGVIVQDFGIVEILKKNFPEMPIHASTQMTVTGPEGMKFLEQKGLARVVPARELSLPEIAALHKASPLEIEVFIHGALCYSYSGQCLFSSFLGGRSGNRGRCAQPCRLPYQPSRDGKSFQGKKDLCPLSLKDICTLDILPEILNAGAVSLKIEGRMKRPEYTAGVVSVYRKYLDRLKKNPDRYKVEEKDRRFLLDIFSRGGSCEGYFHQHNGPDMLAFTNEKKASGAEVPLTAPKLPISGSLILYPGCPAVLDIQSGKTQITLSEGIVQPAQKQPMTEERIRQQMEKCGGTPFIWKNLDIQMEDNIFLPVKLLNELRRKAFEQLEAELLAPYRRTMPKQMSGEEVQTENEAKAVSAQPSDMETAWSPEANKVQSSDIKFFRKSGIPLYASCETREQFQILKQMPDLAGIYAPWSVLKKELETPWRHPQELYLTLPHIVRKEPPKAFRTEAAQMLKNGLAGFLAPNLEAYALLKTWGWAEKTVLDHSMYTWNDRAQAFWEKEHILRNTAPVELNAKELQHRKNENSEYLIYGYLPFMTSAQCVRKNLYGCSGASETVYLSDRYGKKFPIQCVCDPWRQGKADPTLCYNRIYNSLPYGLLKEAEQVKKLGMQSLRLSFTLESPEETRAIALQFIETCLEKKPEYLSEEKNKYQREHASVPEFTKGHFKRGVE